MNTLLFFYNSSKLNTNYNSYINIIFSFLNIQLDNNIKEKFLNKNNSYNLHITFNELNIEEDLTKINFNDETFNEQKININLENNRFCDIVLISNNIYKHTKKLDNILKKYNNYDVQIIERINTYSDYLKTNYNNHIENNYLLCGNKNDEDNITDIDKFKIIYLNDDENDLQSLLKEFQQIKVKNKINNIQKKINMCESEKNKLLNDIEFFKEFKTNIIKKIHNKNADKLEIIKNKLTIDDSKYSDELQNYNHIIKNINKNEFRSITHNLLIKAFCYETKKILEKRTTLIDNYTKLYNIDDPFDGDDNYTNSIENNIFKINETKKNNCAITDKKNERNSNAYIELFESVKKKIYEKININTINIITKIKKYMEDEIKNTPLEILCEKKLNKHYYDEYIKLHKKIENKQLKNYEDKIKKYQQDIDKLCISNNIKYNEKVIISKLKYHTFYIDSDSDSDIENNRKRKKIDTN